MPQKCCTDHSESELIRKFPIYSDDKAQQRSDPLNTPSAPYPTLSTRSEFDGNVANGKLDSLYPHLNDWMGLSLTSQELAVVQNQSNAMAVPQSQTISVANNQMIAPVSATSMGLMRANVTHGIREVTVCKGQDSKVGIRVKDINKVRNYWTPMNL